MSSNSAVKPTLSITRDSISKYPYMWFQCHGPTLGTGDDTNTDLYDRAYANTNGQTTALFTSGLAALTGTGGAGVWTDNTGYFTDSGDDYAKDVSTGVYDFFTPVATGGLLFNFTLNTTATPSEVEYLFSYSDLDSTYGGFSINILTNGKVAVGCRDSGGIGNVNVVVTDDSIATGADVQFTAYLDWGTLSGQLYEDGILQLVSNAMNAPLPTLNKALGMVLFARSLGIAQTGLNSAGTPSQTLVKDLQIFKCTASEAANVAQIHHGYRTNPNAIPRALTE